MGRPTCGPSRQDRRRLQGRTLIAVDGWKCKRICTRRGSRPVCQAGICHKGSGNKGLIMRNEGSSTSWIQEEAMLALTGGDPVCVLSALTGNVLALLEDLENALRVAQDGDSDTECLYGSGGPGTPRRPRRRRVLRIRYRLRSRL